MHLRGTNAGSVRSLEAILSKEDLRELFQRLLPVKIDLGGGELEARGPCEIALEANRGLRVRCKAVVEWPVLGIEVPLALHELTVLLCPQILPRDGVDKLVFGFEIERADFAGVPDFIDERIKERVNHELQAKKVELAWDFAQTLTHVFDLPRTIALAEAVALDVLWGRLRVTDEAVVLAISFQANVLREGARARIAPSEPPPSAPRLRAQTRPIEARSLAVIGALALTAAGGIYATARGMRRH
jgi:hypothetical protein